MSQRDSSSGHSRRPLLGGGEKISYETGRPPRLPNKFHPYSIAEAFERLAPQAARLEREVATLPDELVADDIVVEATLLPNYLAASYYPREIIEKKGLYVVGARHGRAPYKTKSRTREDQPTKTLILAGPRSAVTGLAQAISHGPAPEEQPWNDAVRELHEITLPRASHIVKLPHNRSAADVITWEAVLHPIGRANASAARTAVFEKWVDWIRKIGGEVATDFQRTIDGLTFVPILLSVGDTERAAQFNLLRVLRPMPGIRTCPNVTRGVHLAKSVPPPAPGTKPRYDIRVATFDGGIDTKEPHVGPYTRLHHLTSEPPDPDMQDHGTMVTSMLLYGSVDPQRPLPRPITIVDHFRVLPMAPPPKGTPKDKQIDTQLYVLLDQIVSTVRSNEFDLISLSIGPDELVETDGEPSRWTMELDPIPPDKGSSLVIAPGNNGEDPEPYNTILVPGDVVNGTVVGACAPRRPGSKIVRASFSPPGPGRDGQRVQPLGLQDGDVVGFDRRGRLMQLQGTSFSTPLAARGFVELIGELGPERQSPATIRGFAVHFAERPKRGHKLSAIGYGRFLDHYASIWECAPNECVVLYEIDVDRAQPMAARFPIPDGIDPGVDLDLAWTISYLSEVDAKNPSDYTLCGLDITFRPNEKLRRMSHPKTRKELAILHLENDRERIQAMVSSGAANLGDFAPAYSRWRRGLTEQRRRDGGKWETVIRGGCVRQAGALVEPHLDMQYLRRQRGVLVPDEVGPLRVALLLTMKAPEGVQLYDAVRSQFAVLTPVRIETSITGTGI